MIPPAILDWMRENQGLLWLGGAVSLVIFVGSLLIIPEIVVRIRADYFTHAQRPPSLWASHHGIIRVAIAVGKNLLGFVLMVMGFAMLVLPGQGLLTLLIGFLLIDFPGKYRFEKWLISRHWLHRPINWLRRRRHREPLLIQGQSGSSTNA